MLLRKKGILSVFALRRNSNWIFLFCGLSCIYLLSLLYISGSPLNAAEKSEELLARAKQLEKKEKELEQREKLMRYQEEMIAKKLAELEKVPFMGGTGGTGADFEKMEAVKKAFLHAWGGYEMVWGHDELLPVSGQPSDWCGCGMTILDSLDTLWIMGLREQFQRAKEWVSSSLSFNQVSFAFSPFDVT